MKQGFFHVILFGALLVGTMFSFLDLTSASAESEYQQISVKNGETLWEIAGEYKKETNYSHWEFIQWVEDKNGLNSTDIVPGQKIIIPLKKSQ